MTIVIFLNHAEVKMIFIEGKDLRDAAEPVLPTVKTLKDIYTFDNEGTKYNVLNDLVELGKANVQPAKLQEIKSSILPNDLATIIYTSEPQEFKKG